MARKTKEDARKTRARILASALSLFARKGYERTTFTDIAARLKMTKGAVYWHFDSKEALLIALVDEMLEKFTRRIGALMPREELTFRAVATMMVENARQIVEDPKGRAFFLLMKTQVKWSDDSMSNVREDLLVDERFGPYHAFETAIHNEQRMGTVRADADAGEIASICLAVWDGLVQSRIDGFYKKDMPGAIARAYDAIWHSLKGEKNGREEQRNS